MQQQKLCLKWNNHTVNLLSELETYQQKDILVDVTISCEGRNIKAHKMVLSACSPYFRNIFLENPCQHPIVIINGMKYEDITAILNFMYKGEVNVSHDGLSSFLQAAEALKVKGLAEVCGEKKSTSSNSQESEPVEQARPQRTETPTKKRHRNRKRSFSDSNRSDDEGTTVPPQRKHKEPNSPEVHELSGDESYTGDMSSNNCQSMNSRVPQNIYTRSHQSSSSVISHVEDMEDEFEIEPSKLLEQTLTTENVSMNNSSSDNSLRIERIMGNATEMESSSLQEPESPPDIKPIIEYGESSAGPSEGSMLVYNEQSQPGPSNVQDSSLLHDNSHTQGAVSVFKVPNVHKSLINCKSKHRRETTELEEIRPDPSCTCEPTGENLYEVPEKDLVEISKERENIRNEDVLRRSKQLLIFNDEESGGMRAFEVNKGRLPKDASNAYEFSSPASSSPEKSEPNQFDINFEDEYQSRFSENFPTNHNFSQNFMPFPQLEHNDDAKSRDLCSSDVTNKLKIDKRTKKWKNEQKPKASVLKVFSSDGDIYNIEEDKNTSTLVKKQESVEEVHLTPKKRRIQRLRKTKNKSASEMLMLKRNISNKTAKTSSENNLNNKDSDISAPRINAQTTKKVKSSKAVTGNKVGRPKKTKDESSVKSLVVTKNSKKPLPRVHETYGHGFLPPGFSTKRIRRKSGKSAGKFDIYLYTPDGEKLRSKVAIAEYIQKNSLPFHVDEFNFSRSAFVEKCEEC